GFPGVNGQSGGGMSGGGLSLGTFDEDDDDDGRGRGRRGGRDGGAPGGGMQAMEFPRPNGLRVIGLADPSAGIQEFVENLKVSERTQANKDNLTVKNVHFSEASVLKVPRVVLSEAWTSPNPAFRGAPGAMSLADDQSVYSFEVNIEFDGPYYQAVPKTAVPAA